ncbi:tripartite tricarboxylate transporter permease [Nonomuraea sp. NPDC003754]
MLASFPAYAVEADFEAAAGVRAQLDRGRGGPARNAAAQTSFIPLLTRDLPTHPVMALMVSAFIVHGIASGSNVITDETALFWGPDRVDVDRQHAARAAEPAADRHVGAHFSNSDLARSCTRSH